MSGHTNRQSCHAVCETKYLMGIIGVVPDCQWFMIKYVRIRKLFNPKTVNIRILWASQYRHPNAQSGIFFPDASSMSSTARAAPARSSSPICDQSLPWPPTSMTVLLSIRKSPVLMPPYSITCPAELSWLQKNVSRTVPFSIYRKIAN